MARRAKLYWPPLLGIAAPNSASWNALTSAYKTPRIHTLKKRGTLGRTAAMVPGVRTIPAEMVLPTATAMPKPMPRIWRSLPRSLRGVASGTFTAATLASGEVDKFESRGHLLERHHTWAGGKSKAGIGDERPVIRERRPASRRRARGGCIKPGTLRFVPAFARRERKKKPATPVGMTGWRFSAANCHGAKFA